jgi:hypothetical protein
MQIVPKKGFCSEYWKDKYIFQKKVTESQCFVFLAPILKMTLRKQRYFTYKIHPMQKLILTTTSWLSSLRFTHADTLYLNRSRNLLRPTFCATR